MKTTTIAAMVTAMLTLSGVGPGMWRQLSSEAVADETPDLDRTPPRLAYTHGEISFSRAGAPEWGPAQVNTPLAPGDRLYAAPGGTLELQVGARAFVRASGGQGGAEIGLDGLEPNYLQLSATSGTVALDVRELTPGYAIDVNTPDGVLTIEHSGYYRVEVGPDRAAFLAYRGAGATLTLEDGTRRLLAANEQAVVSGGAAPRLELAAAPGLTEWDRWNYERTDSLLGAASARYVAPRRLRHERPGPARHLAHGARVRLGLGAGRGARRLGAVQHRPMDLGPATSGGPGWTMRRGAGRRITTAAGSTSAATGRGRRGRSWRRCTTRRRSWRSWTRRA